MWISVINHTNGQIADEEVQRVIRAVNQQIEEDFDPYWSMGARLRLEGQSQEGPDAQDAEDIRGDAKQAIRLSSLPLSKLLKM